MNSLFQVLLTRDDIHQVGVGIPRFRSGPLLVSLLNLLRCAQHLPAWKKYIKRRFPLNVFFFKVGLPMFAAWSSGLCRAHLQKPFKGEVHFFKKIIFASRCCLDFQGAVSPVWWYYFCIMGYPCPLQECSPNPPASEKIWSGSSIAKWWAMVSFIHSIHLKLVICISLMKSEAYLSTLLPHDPRVVRMYKISCVNKGRRIRRLSYREHWRIKQST